jgi:hypothetical protein
MENTIHHWTIMKAEEEGASPVVAAPDLVHSHIKVMEQLRHHLHRRGHKSGSTNKSNQRVLQQLLHNIHLDSV